MGAIHELKQPNPLPDDFPKLLRDLADSVERGNITGMVVAYSNSGEYKFCYPSNLHDSVVLAAMLQQNCIDRMRAK